MIPYPRVARNASAYSTRILRLFISASRYAQGLHLPGFLPDPFDRCADDIGGGTLTEAKDPVRHPGPVVAPGAPDGPLAKRSVRVRNRRRSEEHTSELQSRLHLV